MEIVLQWLDEVDDLIFAGFSFWPRVRHVCLSVAALAAVSLLAFSSFDRLPIPSATLVGVAVGALLTWGLLALIGKGAASSRHSMSAGGPRSISGKA